MAGLCLAAIFAVAAVAATSASALPEWGKCVKLETKTGAYSDVNCTTKAKPKLTGEYNWVKGAELANVKFSGGNVGSGGVLTTAFRECRIEGGGGGYLRTTRAKCAEAGGEEVSELMISIECESEKNSGEAVGKNKVANVTAKFLGCKAFGVLPCSNGTEEGEIAVNALKGNLGYINKAEKKVGVLLTPAKSKGEFAKFTCAGFISTVVGVGNAKEGAFYENSPGVEKNGGYDGIISPITPVNTMTSEYEQVFTVNPETFANIPSKFEGKHIELLEDYGYQTESPSETTGWSPAGEELTNVNTAVEPGEIKA